MPRNEEEFEVARASLLVTQSIRGNLITAGREAEVEEIRLLILT